MHLSRIAARRWLAGFQVAMRRGSSHIKRRQHIYGLAGVALVTAIAVALTVQGWRSRIPAFDLLTYIHSAHDLLATGALPEHGDTGSYGSFKPPGTTWLMMPSTILLGDPRLSEYAGTALLHFATLLGVFLLARKYFGTWCASLAVMLYGLSDIGLFLAGSLWPNGRPDFFIWVVFLASEWVTRRDAKYLAAALAVWGLGMYVDMGITPAFFIFPALWLYYRPPVRAAPLLVAGALVVAVWSPYLRFEATRGFADLKSQLLQLNIFPANYRDAWCNPSLVLRSLEEEAAGERREISRLSDAALTAPNQLSILAQPLSLLEGVVRDKLLSNFEPVAPIPGASLALLLMVLISLIALSVPGALAPSTEDTGRRGPRRAWWAPLAIGMVVLGVTANEFILSLLFGAGGNLPEPALSNIRKIQKILIMSGGALLAGRWVTLIAGRWLERIGVHIQTEDSAEKTRLLVLGLAIPWFVLFLLSEAGKPERLWWLWPLQVIFLAAFVTRVLRRLGAARPVVYASQALLIFTILFNPFMQWRVDAWRREGWPGPDAYEVRVVDYVSDRIRAEGKDRAAIGYHTYIYWFMAAYHITNPQYKAGAEIDLFFKYRRGIENTNQCAEGLAPDDEYRIVRTRVMSETWAPREYFDVALDNRYRLLREFGPYQVYQRD